MTKRIGIFTSALFVLALVLVPGRAEARRRYYGGGFGGAAGSKTFGIGLILGSPTGLSAELRLGPQSGLDFALGLDAFEDDRDGGYFHLDYLLYFAQVNGGSVALPFYVGFGGVIWDHDHRYDGDDLHLGLRVPFGMAIALRSVPLQFFFELAVRVMFYDEDDDRYDDSDVDLTGALGFRIYF